MRSSSLVVSRHEGEKFLTVSGSPLTVKSSTQFFKISSSISLPVEKEES